MRRGLWTRLGVGIAAGLLLALALRLFIDPGQALTITDPNKSTTALSVRVLGVEVCQRDGPVEAAESFKAAARTWANALFARWLLLGASVGAGVAAAIPRQAGSK
jgi:hypothetical protein